MKNYTKTILITLLAFFTTVTFAVESAEENTGTELQYNSDKNEALASTSIDPEDLWKDYLGKHNIDDGINKRNGRTFFIVHTTQAVGAPLNDRRFIESRNFAYAKATLDAKTELAKWMKTWVKSDQKIIAEEINNEEASQSFTEFVLKPVSTAERAHKLTNLQLDDEIKKFDPTWSGSNQPKEIKKKKLLEMNERYTRNLSAKARAFLQGAGTIFTAEGYVDGDYSVVVGLAWSFKSAKIAESIYNPNISTPKGSKNLLTITSRLKKLSDKKLAATTGIRTWWDENGNPVILSFSSTDSRGLKSIIKKKTALRARANIGQFVSEIVESDANEKGGEIMQSYDDDSIEAFDDSKFREEINARSKLLPLSGVSTIYYRKFEHPATGKKMVVNVMAWNMESSSLAKGLEKMSKDQETKFNSTKGGAVFDNIYSDSTDSNSLSSGGIITQGLEGVSSNPDDF